jgi:hypothetical protein
MVCASDKARIPPELVGVKFMLAQQHYNPDPPFDSYWTVGQIQDPSQHLTRNGRTVQLHDDCLMLVWASPRE